MGLIQAFSGALSGTLADQWKDIIQAGPFDERTLIALGLQKRFNSGRGANSNGSEAVLSNGSLIYVPEGTAAFIFSESGIEDLITQPGGYEYNNGQSSLFSGGGIASAIIDQAVDRLGFAGISSDEKRVAYINLHEIRNIRFGTRSPLIYHDRYYDVDLEICSYGTFSLQVVEPERVIRSFVPANVGRYSFDDPDAKLQITSEFLQAFCSTIGELSQQYRISELIAKTSDVSSALQNDDACANSWIERFGFRISKVAIESIKLSQESKELVRMFSSNRMSVAAFETVGQQASNIAAQQKIATGIQDFGLGDGAGLLFGMNLAQGINPVNASNANASANVNTNAKDAVSSIEEQLDLVMKLKQLYDAGALTKDEFDKKKSEILGL